MNFWQGWLGFDPGAELLWLVQQADLWLSAALVFLGGTLSLATRRPKLTSPQAWRRLRQFQGWALPLLLNGAFLCALAGLWLRQSFHFAPEILGGFGGAVLGLGLAWRFKRAVGLPLLALGLAAGVLVTSELQAWTPLRGPRDLAQARQLGDESWEWTQGNDRVSVPKALGPAAPTHLREWVWPEPLGWLGARRFVRWAPPGRPSPASTLEGSLTELGLIRPLAAPEAEPGLFLLRTWGLGIQPGDGGTWR